MKCNKDFVLVNLFKQRKNKRFTYTPRHLKENETDDTKSLESQWKDAKSLNKRKTNPFATLPFLVLFLIAILIVLYILSRYE